MREQVRNRILEKYNYKCANCGATENLEIDHILPVSKGGRADEENLQVLCKSCNRKKGNKMPWKKFIKIDNKGNVLIKKNLLKSQAYHENFKQFYSLIDKILNTPNKYRDAFKSPSGKETINLQIGKKDLL